MNLMVLPTTSMSNAGMAVVGYNWETFLDVNTNQGAFDPSLALNSSGNPVVSWYEYDGTSYNIYVKRWNGSSWNSVGTIFDVNTNQ